MRLSVRPWPDSQGSPYVNYPLPQCGEHGKTPDCRALVYQVQEVNTSIQLL